MCVCVFLYLPISEDQREFLTIEKGHFWGLRLGFKVGVIISLGWVWVKVRVRRLFLMVRVSVLTSIAIQMYNIILK